MPAENSSAAEDRPIRRRVRTGCQRCRLRRRKCDERKPICSNCAERNFECHYGLQLRFPAGNARTAPQIRTGAPSSQYTQIRFADDPEDNKDGRQHGNKTATTTAVSQAPAVSSRPRSASHASSSQHGHTASADRAVIFGRREDAGEEATHQQQHSVNTTVTPEYSFQFHHFASPQQGDPYSASPRHLRAGSAEHGAIQSLVSLATSTPQQQPFTFEDNGDSIFQSEHSQPVATPSKQDPPGLNVSTPRSSSVVTSSTRTHIAGAPESPAAAEGGSIDEERSLDLLRYYRYHVAPWLDMLDLNHHLGQHLPTLAATSSSTLYALHALSARHSELASSAVQSESSRYYRTSAMDMSEDVLEARIIRLITDLISTPLSTWPRQLEDQAAPLLTPLYPYVLEAGLAASLFFCVFRLDLAAALATETGMALATDLDAVLVEKDKPIGGRGGWLENPEPADSLDTTCDVVDQSALRALLLCGQAIRIRHNCRLRDAGDERARPQNHLLAWQTAWTELSTWYTTRHKFVKPLLEVSLPSNDDGSTTPAAFPTIFFTTAAATLANLVYHAAAMVLLACKPKTLKNIPGHASPAVSLHWHAQRTCAIAVSADNAGCDWDPCAIACVLLAARRMTHREQQAAVLSTLSRAREATGWGIEAEVRSLREFWLLASHS